MMTKDGRSFVAGRFALALDGSKQAGYLKSVEGGNISAEVVNESGGPGVAVKKNIGNLKYNDFKFALGMSMSADVYAWIKASWDGASMRKNGSVIAADFDYNALSERQFFNACITETVIPEMNGSSKDACYMNVTVAPEEIKYAKASGKLSGEFPAVAQKKWLPCNFRFNIDGMPTKKVNKVDSFKVTQKVVEDQTGDARIYQKEMAKVEMPNISFTLAQTEAQAWYDWFDDFVVKGNCGDDKEKNGSLVFLSQNSTELADIAFTHVGIYDIADEKMEANAESIKRVKVSLYCEQLVFNYGAGKA